MFGPPDLAKYAKAGSTPADVMWADLANTTYYQGDQWLSQASSASFGAYGQIYDPTVQNVVF